MGYEDEPAKWTVESFTEEVELILSSEYGPVWHRAPIEASEAQHAIEKGEEPYDYACDVALRHDMVRRKDWGEADNQRMLAAMGMRWDGERMVDFEGDELDEHCPVCEAMGLHWDGDRLVGEGWEWYDDDAEPDEMTESGMRRRPGDGGEET